MGVHEAVAKSFQEILELPTKSEQLGQDLRALGQLHISEQEKVARVREKAQNLEGVLESLRSEGSSLQSRLSAAEDSERQIRQSVESMERKIVRRKRSIKALGKHFEEVLGILKVTLMRPR